MNAREIAAARAGRAHVGTHRGTRESRHGTAGRLQLGVTQALASRADEPQRRGSERKRLRAPPSGQGFKAHPALKP
jgi:hypothetical protein